MKRLLLIVLFITLSGISASAQSNPPLKIREVDGSPSQTNATELIFPNGTLSRSGTRITFSISGGGFVAGTGTTGRLAQWTSSTTLGNATETGTGNAVRATSPTLVTPTIGSFANANHNHQNSAGGGTLDLTLIGGATVLPPANGGIAVVDTADQGYWCPIASGVYSLSPGAGVISGTNNQVKVIQVVLRFKIVIGRATLEVTTAGAGGSTVTVGIYNASGTTKLLDTGTFNGNSATIQTITFSTVTLNPGTYFFVWSVSDATIQARLLSGNTQWNNIVYNNQTVKKVGNAANSTSGGVLPSSLGTITAANLNAPLVVFER